jgi:hypothetical protein
MLTWLQFCTARPPFKVCARRQPLYQSFASEGPSRGSSTDPPPRCEGAKDAKDLCYYYERSGSHRSLIVVTKVGFTKVRKQNKGANDLCYHYERSLLLRNETFIAAGIGLYYYQESPLLIPDNPTPYTLHPAPSSILVTTPHPTPFTLHLHPTPYTVFDFEAFSYYRERHTSTERGTPYTLPRNRFVIPRNRFLHRFSWYTS